MIKWSLSAWRALRRIMPSTPLFGMSLLILAIRDHDIITISRITHGYSKEGKLGEANSLINLMIARGFAKMPPLCHSLVRRLGARGDRYEVITLLHQMAAKQVVLVLSIMSTIWECHFSELPTYFELSPSFSSEASKW